MKARLESRTPSEVWLAVENDTDADTQLQAVKIIVRWQDAGGALVTHSGPWKPCAMFLGPRMMFRLDVTNLLRQLIEHGLPKLPAGKSVESTAELFTGADSTVFCTSLCLKYDGAKQSFAPLP